MTQSNSAKILADLANEINEHNQSRRACEVKGMMHGLKVGQLLLKAKEVIPHGQFKTWCVENTTVTQRMCQIYMRICKDERLLDPFVAEYETISHLTINKAVKLIREKKTMAQRTEAIKEGWKSAMGHLSEMNTALREARTGFINHGGDDVFQEWLVKETPLSKMLATEFLEKGEITQDAFLDDLLARPAEGGGLLRPGQGGQGGQHEHY